MKLVYNLHVVMAEKGIKSVTELQRKTGLARRTLDRIYHNNARMIDFTTAEKICNTLDCELQDFMNFISDEDYGELIKRKDLHFDYFRNSFVYFIKSNLLRAIKIGRSSDVETRLNQLTESYGELELVHQIKTKDAISLERELHKKYSNKRSFGEWFKLTDKDIEEIKKSVAATTDPE